MKRISIVALGAMCLGTGVVFGADDMTTDARTYLAPLSQDMRSAQSLAAGLERLTAADLYNTYDAYESAYLAEQAVSIAHARAQQLQQADGLTSEERADVTHAIQKLTAASATVGRMQSNMEMSPSESRRQNASDVRLEAANLRAQLADANIAIREVADAHGVSKGLRVAGSGR